jgi:hypothetical protein
MVSASQMAVSCFVRCRRIWIRFYDDLRGGRGYPELILPADPLWRRLLLPLGDRRFFGVGNDFISGCLRTASAIYEIGDPLNGRAGYAALSRQCCRCCGFAIAVHGAKVFDGFHDNRSATGAGRCQKAHRGNYGNHRLATGSDSI